MGEGIVSKGKLSVKPQMQERLMTIQHRRNYCPYCNSARIRSFRSDPPFRKYRCRNCGKRFRTVEASQPGPVWVKRSPPAVLPPADEDERRG